MKLETKTTNSFKGKTVESHLRQLPPALPLAEVATCARKLSKRIFGVDFIGEFYIISLIRVMDRFPSAGFPIPTSLANRRPNHLDFQNTQNTSRHSGRFGS
jgi:hypothetical protein